MRYLFTLGLLAACSGGKDTGTQETGNEDTGTQETGLEPFAPSAGTWILSGVTYETNTCEIDEVAAGEGESEGTWLLTLETDGSYSLSPASFLTSFSCGLEGQELFCDPLSLQEAPVPNQNASVTLAFTMGMVFADEVSAQGSWGLAKTCAGSDCDGLACEVQGTATVAFEESGS